LRTHDAIDCRALVSEVESENPWCSIFGRRGPRKRRSRVVFRLPSRVASFMANLCGAKEQQLTGPNDRRSHLIVAAGGTNSPLKDQSVMVLVGLYDGWIAAEGRPCARAAPGAGFVKSRKVPAGTPGPGAGAPVTVP